MKYSYFSRNFGEARENIQIRIGTNSLDKVESFIQLTYRHYEDDVVMKQGLDHLEWFQSFPEDYRKASCEEFCKLSLSYAGIIEERF